MPRKMRRAALCSALTVKARDAHVVVVDELQLAEFKTRLMASAINSLVGTASALVLVPEKETYTGVIRATNNLPDTKIMLASYLNIRDLLKFDKLVMPLSALDVIKANLG
jgi:large subunit ribosomal protein L4